MPAPTFAPAPAHPHLHTRTCTPASAPARPHLHLHARTNTNTNAPTHPAGKLPFEEAPQDDRHLPDLHLALYNDVIVFDHVTKLAFVISWVSGRVGEPKGGRAPRAASGRADERASARGSGVGRLRCAPSWVHV